MSDSLKTALSSADVMIDLLKSKIEAIEKFKSQLASYDCDLNEAEETLLWRLINEPEAWNEDNRMDPTFCGGKEEKKILRKCLESFENFASSRIKDYINM